MRGSDPIEQTKEDSGIEITDLAKPIVSGNNISSWFLGRLLEWQRPKNRRLFYLIRILSFLLIFIFVIMPGMGKGLTLLLSNSFDPRTGQQLILNHTLSTKMFPSSSTIKYYHIKQQDGIACLLDAQWSPNSTLIAVLGYQHDCPEVNESPGILNIYNASHSKLVAQWQIDDTILNILHSSTKSTGTAVSSFGATLSKGASESDGKPIGFTYLSVLWSPNGNELAISFMTSIEQQFIKGILLFDIDGQNPQLMMQTGKYFHESPLEWDLQSKMALPFKPIQAALQYHWGKNGSLLPEMLLSYDAVPSVHPIASVGNPMGENAFTIWQPGYTALTNIAGLSVWNTNFSAWSPGGHYIFENLSQSGLLEPRNRIGLDAQLFKQLRITSMPLLPAHDEALLQVGNTSSVIAWRPDGQIMAAFNYVDSVNLYDCITGHKIVSLPLSNMDRSLAGYTALLRWSPNGTHLLLSSASGGVITLWGPGQLPH